MSVPPPVPPRTARRTISTELSDLQLNNSKPVQETTLETESTNENEPSESISLEDSQDEEKQLQPANEEEYYEEVPTPLTSGETLFEQSVAPNHYRWFTITVDGNENDIVEITLSRTMHAAAANIFVNYPLSETFPTADLHDWNPTIGPLRGPVGEYKISVMGIPSYIEKDDKYLVDPNSNWASFDLYAEWSLLDDETKEKYRKVAEEYSHEKSSNVWSSNYSKEFEGKYRKQQEDYEHELCEREEQLKQQGLFKEAKLEEIGQLTTKYTITEELGSRSDFVVVKRAKENSTGKEYAVKIINKTGAKLDGIEEKVWKQQVEVLGLIGSHKNIVQFKEYYENDELLCLIFELCEGGELIGHLLGSIEPSKYDENTARLIIQQLLSAVEHLHSLRIVHKSIVPENILFTSKQNLELKLIGFNLSQITNDDKEFGISGGDPTFQAPEILNNEGYGRAVDCWAVGCIAYILLCGSRPFKDSNTMRLYAKIRQGSYPMDGPSWNAVSSEAKDFVQQLLCVDIQKRSSASQSLQHPWIKKTEGGNLAIVLQNLKGYY